jgi:GntR family transcriptional repressor for pyruvate dehydrogenase complex
MLEQLKQVDGRRLYQQIADQIRALILQGCFQPGTRLPTERELAQQLRVSRPSVREALIALEIEGSVEVRMGAGVYVGKVSDRPAPSLGESPTELMHARVMLEGEVIVQACARMTPQGLAAIRQAFEDMRDAIAAKRPCLEADRRFHLAIAATTGNSVIERLVRELYDERHSPLSKKFSAHSETERRTWIHALEEHGAILQALETRDALAAQARMRQHLHESAQRWVDGGQNNWT